MKESITVEEVMEVAATNSDLQLFTLSQGKLFHVRVSQADPPGLRFDHYTTGTYVTIKRDEVQDGVATFNRLDPIERSTPSRYQGKHFAASYLAAFLNYCAGSEPQTLPSNENNLPETSGQGYGLTPTERKAVENWGMECASAHYCALGWTVERRGKPFDLLLTKTTGETRYVEVKASTGELSEILVTHGEINFACENPGKVELFLLENVQLNGKRASGGAKEALPWACDRTRAVPTHYRYRLDRTKRR